MHGVPVDSGPLGSSMSPWSRAVSGTAANRHRTHPSPHIPAHQHPRAAGDAAGPADAPYVARKWAAVRRPTAQSLRLRRRDEHAREHHRPPGQGAPAQCRHSLANPFCRQPPQTQKT